MDDCLASRQKAKEAIFDDVRRGLPRYRNL